MVDSKLNYVPNKLKPTIASKYCQWSLQHKEFRAVTDFAHHTIIVQRVNTTSLLEFNYPQMSDAIDAQSDSHTEHSTRGHMVSSYYKILQPDTHFVTLKTVTFFCYRMGSKQLLHPESNPGIQKLCRCQNCLDLAIMICPSFEMQ